MKMLMAVAVAGVLMLAGCVGGSKGDLHQAALNGHVEIVKVLLEAGADVNAKSGRSGLTPLHEAAKKEHVDEAAKNGHVETVKVLLKAGADVNAEDGDGDTPLLYAAGKRTIEDILNPAVNFEKVEIVKMLLKEGANVNAKNKNGRTPLYWPMKQGKDNVVKVLVEAGAKYTP